MMWFQLCVRVGVKTGVTVSLQTLASVLLGIEDDDVNYVCIAYNYHIVMILNNNLKLSKIVIFKFFVA